MADDVVVNERLYWNADKSRLVPDGDPEAAFLFASVGTAIPHAEAVRYGLVGAKEREAPAEDKARHTAPENKAKR